MNGKYLFLILCCLGCSETFVVAGEGGDTSTDTGGTDNTGGDIGTGGFNSSGGSLQTGGVLNTGGFISTGGTDNTGGDIGTGGSGNQCSIAEQQVNCALNPLPSTALCQDKYLVSCGATNNILNLSVIFNDSNDLDVTCILASENSYCCQGNSNENPFDYMKNHLESGICSWKDRSGINLIETN